MINKQNEIKKRLSQVIKNSGKSLKSISEETGIGYSAISNYSQGSRIPKMDTMHRLAEYFGVSVNFLMGVDETAKEDLNLKEIQALIGNFIQKNPLPDNDEDFLEKDGIGSEVALCASILSLINMYEHVGKLRFDEFLFGEYLYLHGMISVLAKLTNELVSQRLKQNIWMQFYDFGDDVSFAELQDKVFKCEDKKEQLVGKALSKVIEYIDSVSSPVEELDQYLKYDQNPKKGLEDSQHDIDTLRDIVAKNYSKHEKL